VNRRLRIGDIDVAWTEEGDGPPVVFVHGLAEDRHTWAYQQQHMPGRHTYAYDLRGHGETTVGDADGTAEQLSADLVRFLCMVTGPATCVGFSLGGTVVLGAAAAAPELVTKAIVVGTSSVVGRGAVEFFRTRIDQVESNMLDEFREGMRDDTAAAIANPSIDIDAITAHRLRAVGDGRGYVNAARAMARVNAHPLTDIIRTITMHIDVVGSTLDTFCPRKAADLLLATLPDATYWELDGAAHLMNVDDPAGLTRILDSILEVRTKEYT